MPTRHIRSAAVARALLLTMATALLVPAAQSATPAAAGGLPGAEARYRADRAACLDSPASQDRNACLRDAGAVLAEARAAQRRPAPPQAEPDYAANALARCERVPERDRADCRLRMQGRGTQEGSVAEGAIMYELVTRSGVPVDKAASAP